MHQIYHPIASKRLKRVTSLCATRLLASAFAVFSPEAQPEGRGWSCDASYSLKALKAALRANDIANLHVLVPIDSPD